MTAPLLPAGCYDVLPPFAAQESALLARLLAVFEAHGYEQVAPPLLEYTESLLSGRGGRLAQQIFRVMDAQALKVMGIRPDITLQIARLASTRLAQAPLPLRLSYAGNVLRMKPEGPSNARQLRQAGIELIGCSSPEANAEVITVASAALKAAGVRSFTVDLHLPGTVPLLLAGEALSEAEAEAVLSAVAQKDVSGAALRALSCHSALAALIEACGPAAEMLPRLLANRALLPLAPLLESLARMAGLLTPLESEGVALSVDVTEARGFEYHTGIGFSFFAPGMAQELGRGGGYRIESGAFSREATGFTLYMDPLRHLLPAPAPAKRVLVSGDISATQRAALQAEGYVTLNALPEFPATPEQARALGCCALWREGALHSL